MKNLLMKLLILLIIVTLSSNANAFQVIAKGAVAPFTGVLVTEEEMRGIQKDLVESDFLKKELEQRKKIELAYTDRISLTDLQVEKYKDYSLILENRLHKLQERSEWDKVIWFTLGFIGTAATVKIGKELSR